MLNKAVAIALILVAGCKQKQADAQLDSSPGSCDAMVGNASSPSDGVACRDDVDLTLPSGWRASPVDAEECTVSNIWPPAAAGAVFIMHFCFGVNYDIKGRTLRFEDRLIEVSVKRSHKDLISGNAQVDFTAVSYQILLEVRDASRVDVVLALNWLRRVPTRRVVCTGNAQRIQFPPCWPCDGGAPLQKSGESNGDAQGITDLIDSLFKSH